MADTAHMWSEGVHGGPSDTETKSAIACPELRSQLPFPGRPLASRSHPSRPGPGHPSAMCRTPWSRGSQGLGVSPTASQQCQSLGSSPVSICRMSGGPGPWVGHVVCQPEGCWDCSSGTAVPEPQPLVCPQPSAGAWPALRLLCSFPDVLQVSPLGDSLTAQAHSRCA